jgi:16S rRNA (guanine966-N2)-methyltransferase
MRISGGKARGIQLQSTRGLKTRPSADVLREALFSSLGARVEGCRFIDLFAGTGAYGLEAWSRGADGGVFVEKSASCCRCIAENIARVAKSSGGDATALLSVCSDVFSWRGAVAHSFDLVFADPPYELLPDIITKLSVLSELLLVRGGLFVLETPANLKLELIGWKLGKQLGKKRGRGPALYIYQRSSDR